MSLVVLGVDPGLTHTGWGVVETRGNSLKHRGHGVITTDRHLPLAQRLCQIYDEVGRVIEFYSPRGAGVESLFFSQNARTAIPVSHARGVLLLAMASKGLEVREFSPLQIKKNVVGVGSSDKGQVQRMVQLLLNLSEISSSDHAADALAAAICYIHGEGPCFIA